MCAYAIQQIVQRPSCCSIRQYYTFDEEFSALQAYRSLAEQLADHIWTQLDDMPEEIHEYTQRSATSSKEDVKTVIDLLLSKAPLTYIFLDGLDEECDTDERWNELEEVLDFFIEMSVTDGSRLRIWCSGQDRAKIRKKLETFNAIEVNKSLNERDIEVCLAERISCLETQELGPGYRARILKDILHKADGRFLWASLMLDSIVDASTLKGVQQLVEQGLPENYGIYYERKIQSVDKSKKRLLS